MCENRHNEHGWDGSDDPHRTHLCKELLAAVAICDQDPAEENADEDSESGPVGAD
jgi:hypothetical protein